VNTPRASRQRAVRSPVVIIRPATELDWPLIYPIYAAIMAEGKTYAFPRILPGRPGPPRPGHRPYRICQLAVGSEQRHFRQDDAERPVAIERQHNARGRVGGGPGQRVVIDRNLGARENRLVRLMCYLMRPRLGPIR